MKREILNTGKRKTGTIKYNIEKSNVVYQIYLEVLAKLCFSKDDRSGRQNISNVIGF